MATLQTEADNRSFSWFNADSLVRINRTAVLTCNNTFDQFLQALSLMVVLLFFFLMSLVPKQAYRLVLACLVKIFDFFTLS